MSLTEDYRAGRNAALLPTPTEIRAHRARQAFYKKIEAAAAALQNIDPDPLKAEAVAAEPDPPIEPENSVLDCPQCAELKAALELYRPARGRAYPPIKAIQAVVASDYNVTRGDLCSARRTANVVRPRQIAMYLTKEMTPFSLPQIGRQFGGRDHTTVLHAVRKIGAMMFADARFALEVVWLRQMLETDEAG